MILVSEIKKNIENNIVKYYCEYELDGEKKELWFKTELNNDEYIQKNNCDAFFIILSLLAIEKEIDIKFESKVSAELLYNMKSYLAEIVSTMSKKSRKINIFADADVRRIDQGIGVATAMSMGIDSFYSLYSNIDKEFPVTHLTLFNAGTFGSSNARHALSLFEDAKKQVEFVAKDLKLPLIWLDSNINETIKMTFIQTHSYRHMACASFFSNLLGRYYYSSGHKINDFKVDFSDSANYDLLLSKALSSSRMDISISGLIESRVRKTIEISNYNPTKKYLNVCLITDDANPIKNKEGHFTNCSKCHKCVRTLITLDVIGKIDEYSDVFDLSVYRKSKDKHFAEMIYHFFRSRDVFSTEILSEIKKRKFKINKIVYLYLIKRVLKSMRLVK
ncbi:hypothetical protein VXS04_16975 [Photobacterium piscicola]|uniref:hypothetical protein n=1 Tax=Photobacterium piscicola TaxID=1378299 RepID=UPI002E1810F6|nr:hypothetical protein [Photobacterium piscicola]